MEITSHDHTVRIWDTQPLKERMQARRDRQDIVARVEPMVQQLFNELGDAAGVADRIDLRLAPAQQSLHALIADGREGYYDFAYIDADKAGYRGYVEACFTLVRSGGLIAIDNVLWGGSVADPEDQSEDTCALRDLNQWLHQHATGRFDLSMVPIGDGLTLLRLF